MSVSNQNRIRGLINELEWFIAPGIADLWRIVTEGIRDHHTGRTICGFLDGHAHGGGRIRSYDQENFHRGMNLNEVSGWPVEYKRAGTGMLHAGPAFSTENIEHMTRWQLERPLHAAWHRAHPFGSRTLGGCRTRVLASNPRKTRHGYAS